MDIHVWLLLGFVVVAVMVWAMWSRVKWLAISVSVIVLVPLGLLLAVVR